MIFVFFKLIFCIGFIINMQFSKIDCNENLVVALLKIVMNEKGRYVPELFTAYRSRNPILVDPLTNIPYIFMVKSQISRNAGQVNDEFYNYNLNADFQIIMNEDEANKILPETYLTTIHMMKHKEFNERFFYFDTAYITEFRQHQFNSFLLYPKQTEDIYNYWNRIYEPLKSCLLNNSMFHFVPVKMNHIEEIRTNIVYVQQDDGETDEDYSIRKQKHHKWFETMISTRPINGEGTNNYHLRMIRLGFVSLSRDNLRIFYNDFIKYERRHLKIYDPKNNFFQTEFFVTHIICNCMIPKSEIIDIEDVPTTKNFREISSQYLDQGESSKRHRGT